MNSRFASCFYKIFICKELEMDCLVAIILYVLYSNVLNAEETLAVIALYVVIYKLIIPCVFGILAFQNLRGDQTKIKNKGGRVIK